jgi:hypothetical protein
MAANFGRLLRFLCGVLNIRMLVRMVAVIFVPALFLIIVVLSMMGPMKEVSAFASIFSNIVVNEAFSIRLKD